MCWYDALSESTKTSTGPAVIVPVRDNGAGANRSRAALPDFNDEDDAVLTMCADNDGDDDLLLASSLDTMTDSEQMTLSYSILHLHIIDLVS